MMRFEREYFGGFSSGYFGGPVSGWRMLDVVNRQLDHHQRCGRAFWLVRYDQPHYSTTLHFGVT
jgi:hypothetical protein